MKIYEIGTGYTPIPAQVAAATESVVEELTKVFIKANQEVTIIDISTTNRVPNTLPIIEVKVPSFLTRSDVSLGIVHKLKRVAYSIALSLKLKKILKKQTEKTVLHFHNQYNLFFFLKLVSKKLRSKAVIAYTNHNGMWSLPWNEVEQTLRKRYFQEIEAMKKADLVFALNSATRDNVIKYLNIPSDKVVLINNGVNTDVYTPLLKEKISEIKQKYGISGKKVILQVGSVYENKGQDRSLKMLAPVLKEQKDLVYAYVGGIVSQEYFDKLQSDIKELELEESVVYLGSVSPGEEMNELYNIADATLFVSKYEGFPLVCIESLSAGVPVILCSNSLTDFGDGCVVCNENTFENAVSDALFGEANNYSELCEKARLNVNCNYSWEKTAQDYLQKF